MAWLIYNFESDYNKEDPFEEQSTNSSGVENLSNAEEESLRQSRSNEKQNFDFSLSTTRSKSSKNTETDNNLKSTSSKRTQPEYSILGLFLIEICNYSIQTGEKILQRIFLINFLPMRALKLKTWFYPTFIEG